jgi:hypothetical protein
LTNIISHIPVFIIFPLFLLLLASDARAMTDMNNRRPAQQVITIALYRTDTHNIYKSVRVSLLAWLHTGNGGWWFIKIICDIIR